MFIYILVQGSGVYGGQVKQGVSTQPIWFKKLSSSQTLVKNNLLLPNKMQNKHTALQMKYIAAWTIQNDYHNAVFSQPHSTIS